MTNAPGPPGGPAGWGPPPPPPRRGSRTCLVVALVVAGLVAAVVALVIVLVVVAADQVDDPGPDGPDTDVAVATCEVDPTTRLPHAGLTVTNRSSEASDYVISVEFVTASGTRVAEANAAVDNLAPGQVANQRAQSLTKVGVPVNCNVTDVTRLAS
ncbi:hypothetical protein [Streptomyces ficellus]|uniref:DUF4307 domain-containing protein n=1 Tax=Streptomyces ficellus TaxID=1977088 RepID=A0A6I6F618_9ACTN|nr:hypothetical protein [Streptomyces ficellus]QGV79503.1 hypothetical protein EIZ62_15560 [Streptomyces ficellus]